jgi:M6 family metalloprotease-like protein
MPKARTDERAETSAERAAAALGGSHWPPRPVSGPKNVLVILVQFADRSLSTTASGWDSVIFDTGSGAKSVANFYTDNSFDTMSVEPVAHSQPGNPAGIVTVTLASYHPDYGGNIQYDPEIAWINEALAEAATVVDFPALDTDGDGVLQNSEAIIYFILAGYEASGTLKRPSIWAHAWGGSGVSAGGIDVRRWAVNGELNDDDAQHPMGVIAHELGHSMCGLADLYDTSYYNAGLGIFSLMAYGSWGMASTDAYAGTTPVSLDAWSRQYVGWASPRVPTSWGTMDFGPALSSPDAPVKLDYPDVSTTEYFLVENRYPTGWDLGMEDQLGTDWGGGLLVIHVDETIGTPSRNNINAYVPGSHQGVMAEEASTINGSLVEGTSEGDVTHLFWDPNNTTFDDLSTPNSRLYDGTSIYVGLYDISVRQETMTATVHTPGGMVARPTFDPDGGTFGSGVSVTISCATDGATIYYTTNGNEPTESDPTVDSGSSVLVDATMVLKAKAFKTGLPSSLVKSAVFRIGGVPYVIHVKTDGDDLNDGSNWALAKKTVQAGINTPMVGDEVWVAAGTYEERITLKSAVSVYGGFEGNETARAERDWTVHVTILDGNAVGSVVTVPSGVAASTVIDGFTIRNGSAERGGGIHAADYASPVISNNRITGNRASSGAGIYCFDYGSPTILNNVIIGNSVLDWGGGIYIRNNPNATISNNTIVYNTARWGAGVAAFHSVPTITNNTISLNNASTGNGGGIYLENTSTAIITDNRITGNDAPGGAGIHCSNSSAVIANNRIAGNAGTFGAGIYYSHSAGTTQGNVIIGNFAANQGGAIYCSNYSTPTIANNSITKNTAEADGGAIYSSKSSPIIGNNIIAFNFLGIVRSGGAPTLMNNCVYGNEFYDYAGLAPGNGDISVDPKLASLEYGDMHIQPDSPCRNAGANSLVQLGWVDMDGQARIQGGRVDIGADESDGTTWIPSLPVVYVTTTGSDNNDGSTWDLAKRTVQGAIDTASARGGEVWVKAGTYGEALLLQPYVYLYGGFNGTETDRQQRNWVTNASVVDAAQTGTVITLRGGYMVTGVDGFTVQNGWGGWGGGISCFNGSTTIVNNTITTNDATYGGGIFCYYYADSTIRNNTITTNNAYYGGAIFCYTGSDAIISNNDLSDNIALDGGAVYTYNSAPRISSNIITGNVAYYDSGEGPHGGGVFTYGDVPDAPSATITNNTFVGNSAYSGSGAFRRDYGGGVYTDGSENQPLIANNIFAFNASGIQRAAGTLTLRNNCVYENTAYNYSGTFPGSGDIEADPVFVSKTLGDYHLRSFSPCIDTGDSSVVQAGDMDIDGQPRIYGARVDMGADEWRGLLNQSLDPNRGTLVAGVKLTFTSKYAHPDGYQHLANCHFLLNGTVVTGVNAAYVMYDAAANKLYVRNNASTAWLGGYAPGSANTIENGSCKLYCAETTATGSGTTLTIVWKMELKPTVSGRTVPAWMLVFDDVGLRDGWDQMGTFRVSQPPANVSLSPNSGMLATGRKLTFTSTYSDSDGYGDLAVCHLLFNTTTSSGANTAYVIYDANTNKLYLRNDASTAWLGGYRPGSTLVIENSYCKLYCQDTTVTGSGTTLTINWKIELKPSMAGRTLPAWMTVFDDAGLRDDWDQMGSFKVDNPPANASLYPNRGTLATTPTKLTITSRYSDGDGYADIASCYFLLNTTPLSGANTAYVMYDAVANKLYVRNDASTAWLGGFAPGSANTIENSYCKLYCAETTVAGSGIYLTVVWKMELKATMSGRLAPAWMTVFDKSGVRDSWDQMGNFAIQ